MSINDFLGDLIRQAFYLPRAILVAIPMILAWMFWKDNQGHIRERLSALKGKWWITAFFVYVSYILVSTIIGRTKEYPLGSVISHLFPGDDIRVWKMNIENMLMFVPYSFLFLQAFKPDKPWYSSTILVIITALAIESYQLLFWLGVFQISDVIFNLIGGIIGTAVWVLWKCISSKNK